MRAVTSTFFGLFFLVHWAGGAKLFHQPLSLMRDNDFAPIGYLLFVLLIGMGICLCRKMIETEQYEDLWVVATALFMLIVVMATPSLNAFHIFCSLVLILTLYVYYAIKLYQLMSPWLCAHLVMPPLVIPWAVVTTTGMASYGAWQKLLILCFVIELNVHHALLSWRNRSLRGTERRLADVDTTRLQVLRGKRIRGWS